MKAREELEQLQERLVRRNYLEGRRSSLQSQQRELEQKVLTLSCECDSYERDIDRLEGRSLASFFSYVTGRRKKQIEEGKQEAYAAAVKCDAAKKELEAVKQELEEVGRELSEYRGIRERCRKLMLKVREELKVSGSSEGEQILRLEEQLTFLKTQKKEIEEALSAGRAALAMAESVHASLSHAEGYATWDLLGGGLIADIAKHSHLDDAQQQIENLQIKLRQFQTELADIRIHTDMKVNVDGFLKFADYFFDGLFVDWTVYHKITDSKTQIVSTIEQLKTAVQRLEQLKNVSEGQAKNCGTQIDEIVTGGNFIVQLD